jgi:hypothetical protein
MRTKTSVQTPSRYFYVGAGGLRPDISDITICIKRRAMSPTYKTTTHARRFRPSHANAIYALCFFLHISGTHRQPWSEKGIAKTQPLAPRANRCLALKKSKSITALPAYKNLSARGVQ